MNSGRRPWRAATRTIAAVTGGGGP